MKNQIQTFKEHIKELVSKQICALCGKQAVKFRNDVSIVEYSISGMCQECQDSVFGVD